MVEAGFTMQLCRQQPPSHTYHEYAHLFSLFIHLNESHLKIDECSAHTLDHSGQERVELYYGMLGNGA